MGSDIVIGGLSKFFERRNQQLSVEQSKADIKSEQFRAAHIAGIEAQQKNYDGELETWNAVDHFVQNGDLVNANLAYQKLVPFAGADKAGNTEGVKYLYDQDDVARQAYLESESKWWRENHKRPEMNLDEIENIAARKAVDNHSIERWVKGALGIEITDENRGNIVGVPYKNYMAVSRENPEKLPSGRKLAEKDTDTWVQYNMPDGNLVQYRKSEDGLVDPESLEVISEGETRWSVNFEQDTTGTLRRVVAVDPFDPLNVQRGEWESIGDVPWKTLKGEDEKIVTTTLRSALNGLEAKSKSVWEDIQKSIFVDDKTGKSTFTGVGYGLYMNLVESYHNRENYTVRDAAQRAFIDYEDFVTSDVVDVAKGTPFTSPTSELNYDRFKQWVVSKLKDEAEESALLQESDAQRDARLATIEARYGGLEASFFPPLVAQGAPRVRQSTNSTGSSTTRSTGGANSRLVPNAEQREAVTGGRSKLAPRMKRSTAPLSFNVEAGTRIDDKTGTMFPDRKEADKKAQEASENEGQARMQIGAQYLTLLSQMKENRKKASVGDVDQRTRSPEREAEFQSADKISTEISRQKRSWAKAKNVSEFIQKEQNNIMHIPETILKYALVGADKGARAMIEAELERRGGR
jgi:hypothetical protein